MSLQALIKKSENFLCESPSPRLDVELLLSHVLQKPRAYLIAHSEEEPSGIQLENFEQLLTKRKMGVPIAYLTGHQEFWSLDFLVNESVLIPRPETEILVETILEKFSAKQNIQLLDLGTGSGAIALAIAHERPTWQIIATDQSVEALNLARENAHRLNVHNIQFVLSDWFNNVSTKNFDAIISNPPYVAEGDAHLKEGDVRFEPQAALVSGEDGLSAIRFIASCAHDYLRPRGLLAIEHGFDQASDVRKIFEENNFREIESIKDLSGIERVVLGETRGS